MSKEEDQKTLTELTVKLDVLTKDQALTSKKVDEQHEEHHKIDKAIGLNEQAVSQGFASISEKLEDMCTSRKADVDQFQSELKVISKNQSSISEALVKLMNVSEGVGENRMGIKKLEKDLTDAVNRMEDVENEIKKELSTHMTNFDTKKRIDEEKFKDLNDTCKGINDQLIVISQQLVAFNTIKTSGKGIFWFISVLATLAAIVAAVVTLSK